MTDRQRRIAKLVEDIRAALDHGVDPGEIHAALVRRNLPPAKATALLQRVQASMPRPRLPAPAASMLPSGPAIILAPRSVPTRPARSQRRPFFLALGFFLLVTGLGTTFSASRETATEVSAVQVEDRATRLDAELVSARTQLAYIDDRLEERRVDAEQIEWLRARVARGPDSFASFADYEEMFARYERRRARWNRTLPQYRVVSGAYRTLAEIHNAKLDSLKTLAGNVARVSDATVARYTRIAAVAAPM